MSTSSLPTIPVDILCPECGCDAFSEETILNQFPYGSDGSQVMLSASMPIMECQNCGYEYFDVRGEQAQHDAVCKHLGVLSPAEIQTIRSSVGMTRADFANLAGVGDASLQRWESGTLIQHKANDRLIYLLQFETVRELLSKRHVEQEESARKKQPNCRTDASQDADEKISRMASDQRLRRDSDLFSSLMLSGAIFQPASCDR